MREKKKSWNDIVVMASKERRQLLAYLLQEIFHHHHKYNDKLPDFAIMHCYLTRRKMTRRGRKRVYAGTFPAAVHLPSSSFLPCAQGSKRRPAHGRIFGVALLYLPSAACVGRASHATRATRLSCAYMRGEAQRRRRRRVPAGLACHGPAASSLSRPQYRHVYEAMTDGRRCAGGVYLIAI